MADYITTAESERRMWPFVAVKDSVHPSARKRRVELNGSGGEEGGGEAESG